MQFGPHNCLKINELKIDQFSSINNLPEQLKDKDFLDVDVASDMLPSVTTIYDVQTEPVCIQSPIDANL